MVRKKKINFTLGCNQWERKAMSKPLIKIVIGIQNEAINKQKNSKSKSKRKPSFAWATLELSRRLKKNGLF